MYLLIVAIKVSQIFSKGGELRLQTELIAPETILTMLFEKEVPESMLFSAAAMAAWAATFADSIA